MMQTKQQAKLRRSHRVRAKITGTAERPRLSVNVSNRHIIAQLIDDTAGKTLGFVTTVNQKTTGTRTEQAEQIGKAIAEAAKKHKIKAVVFDRGSRLYHGRLHALATAARNEGLEF
jgi:large subunit ribosomal protein L18